MIGSEVAWEGPAMVVALALLAIGILLVPLLIRWFGRYTGYPLAVVYLLAAAVLVPTAQQVLVGATPQIGAPWVPSLGVELALRADGLGLIFAMLALLVGAVVLCYASAYLSGDRQTSLYALMAVFTFSMVGLVLADDLVLLFICWELTSIASFLLVARSGRPGEAAALRTMLITFTGGLALLIAVVLSWQRTGTTRLSAVLADPVWHTDPAFTSLIAVCVLIAGFTKSAQFPFHVWLPEAMAAPAPVSAYLHAAAVVKAGIFLLLRFTPAFHATLVWNAALIITGLFTAILGGWFALHQHDLKKLMAYSTVSQLGLIVAAVGVGTPVAITAAVLHTIAHALFKSGLFMIVGVIDHAAKTRDLTRLPQLYRTMPWSFAITLLGCASMAGVPPMLGFISKEGVLAALVEARGPVLTSWLAVGAAAFGAVLTAAYCIKIAFGGFVDGTSDRPVHRQSPSLVLPAALPIVVGVPIAFMVGVLDRPVAMATLAALPGSSPDPYLALWHGFTPELAITAVILGLGAVVLRYRRRVLPRLERPLVRFDGADVITGLNNALARAGRFVVRAIAADYPSRQLVPIMWCFALVVLLGAGALGPQLLPARTPHTTRPVDALLLVLIGVAVLVLCHTRSRLAATVALSAVGVFATVQIFALGAPDVGLTQLLVEGLTVILIMLVLQRLPQRFGSQPRRRRWRTGLLAVVTGLAAGVGTFTLTGRRPRSDLADYYLTQAEPITGGNNVVNVILVEFRAMDTFGELVVLGMAALVIVAIFSTVRHEHIDPVDPIDPDEAQVPPIAVGERGTPAFKGMHDPWGNSIPLRLLVRAAVPLLGVFAATIFWRGHNNPGGAFISALVICSMIALVYLSTARDRAVGPPKLPRLLIGGGVLISSAVGLWGLVAEGAFLAPLHGYLGGVHLSSALLFDVGVMTAVVGLILVAFNLLGASGSSSDPSCEHTRQRTDEICEGQLTGPMDTVRGERVPVPTEARAPIGQVQR